MCLLTLWDPRLRLLGLLVCRDGDAVGEHELNGDMMVLHTALYG
jgi:hypothetical protein